ncbi:MAG TPA: arginine--tRNA ligase [Anaerohalosphaeraceae bacterium]|jgi:arginyl-tRNA synthetase|nr:arginine--tRNA ligase [Anaerohalosphaeraceae bacterium]HRT51788.1 arginine--tRNA ligase [Anaerohalosphaeraceae bacterium]HRT87806.1 arginine--tRNA ligase [Anaerohalosphaeraceae bacterium]
MKPVITMLDELIGGALKDITGQTFPALVRPASDPKFGDYQVNGVMAAAKQLRMNPRQLAEKIVASLDITQICDPPQIAGPGFINLRLRPEYLAARLLEIAHDEERLAVDKADTPRRIVVDFSCPNIAKQMHVGHLRSTILGDAICRLLEFEGHSVIRQNHIGDWGTQFGMLIAFLKQTSPEIIDRPESVHIADLEQFYRDAKARCDADEAFAAASRQEVVNLHVGDAETLKVWRHIVDESRRHYQPVYDILEVNLHQDNERGESFYADRLAGIVEELKQKGLAVESDGAMCVFPEGFVTKEGQPLPFIIQKSDGAFLYATTDLAALKYRIEELKADEIVYVTDARQKQHFEMLFATARLAGWVPDGVKLVHVMFGTVLGEDNRPLKTRSGQNVKLRDLLDEAVQRARAIVEEKNPQLDDTRKARIARAVGIGAVKYADYANNRTSDYVFSFDRMLAMDGNTAPYMQYAYARVKSIERKAAGRDVDIEKEVAGISTLTLVEPAELDLARHLVRYGEVIENTIADYRPNYLTSFLYELAQKFSGFYNTCPVLGADAQSRPTRLLLCDVTARTIAHGLSTLLGIRVVEQM